MKLIAKNKRAFFDYEILETYEAGIVLSGQEVKSIREGRVQLKGSFARVDRGHVFAENIHITPYRFSQPQNYDPTRRRQLLLHKKEIEQLAAAADAKGLTLIPLEVFFKGNLIKIRLGICRGKKLHDKRASIKKREINREIQRDIKR